MALELRKWINEAATVTFLPSPKKIDKEEEEEEEEQLRRI